MEGTMKVAVMTDIQKMGFEERTIPVPKDNEVLVKLDYVGICGSDLHYYETGAIGDYVVKPPFVLGHEPGGVVVEVGKDVKHLKAGDKVALEPGKTCGHCEFCREGKYNLCPDVVFFATPPVDGVFQEYVAHEADLCFKLPENVSTLEGALIEPLAVGFHAAVQGDAHLGQKAVVMGAGCIGLVSMMALKARGVSEVYVVDVMDKRLEKAMELGATGVINGMKEDVVAKVKELTDGKGTDGPGGKCGGTAQRPGKSGTGYDPGAPPSGAGRRGIQVLRRAAVCQKTDDERGHDVFVPAYGGNGGWAGPDGKTLLRLPADAGNPDRQSAEPFRPSAGQGRTGRGQSHIPEKRTAGTGIEWKTAERKTAERKTEWIVLQKKPGKP